MTIENGQNNEDQRCSGLIRAHTNESGRKPQVRVMFQFLSMNVFLSFRWKWEINRLMHFLDIDINYHSYSLCVRFSTAWNMWCLMSVSDLSSKCVATPFFAATFSAAFGSVWPRVINRQGHTKTTNTAWTVPIRKMGLNRYQYQHKSFHIQQNKLLRVDFWTIWGFLEMLFPELCDNSCLRWGPPYNSFILGSSLHMCKILMRSSLCVVFSLARTFLASLGRTAAAAAMQLPSVALQTTLFCFALLCCCMNFLPVFLLASLSHFYLVEHTASWHFMAPLIKSHDGTMVSHGDSC